MEPCRARAVLPCTRSFSTLFTGQVNGTASVVLDAEEVILFQYPLHGSSKWNGDMVIVHAGVYAFQYPLHGSSKWNTGDGADSVYPT